MKVSHAYFTGDVNKQFKPQFQVTGYGADSVLSHPHTPALAQDWAVSSQKGNIHCTCVYL